jgi:DNA-binding NarL/FixJ family response regulator
MPFLNLTSRELELLEKLSNGWSNKQIAAALDIKPNTVRVHLQNIFPKLGVHSRFEAIVMFKDLERSGK